MAFASAPPRRSDRTRPGYRGDSTKHKPARRLWLNGTTEYPPFLRNAIAPPVGCTITYKFPSIVVHAVQPLLHLLAVHDGGFCAEREIGLGDTIFPLAGHHLLGGSHERGPVPSIMQSLSSARGNSPLSFGWYHDGSVRFIVIQKVGGPKLSEVLNVSGLTPVLPCVHKPHTVSIAWMLQGRPASTPAHA